MIDYVLDLTDPCRLQLLNPQNYFAEGIEFKIGSSQLKVQTELRSPLCPENNGFLSYRTLDCVKLADDLTETQCSQGLVTTDKTQGDVTIGTKDVSFVGKYRISVQAWSEFEKVARIAATFKLIISDGCDTYSNIIQQYTI